MVEISLKITCEAAPIQIQGTINGVGVYYRARGGRWELYSGGVQCDPDGKPVSLGAACVDTGPCANGDEDDVSTALFRIFDSWPAWGLEEGY